MAPRDSKEALEIPDIKRRDLIVPIKCSDCIFYKRLAILPKPCQELGTPPSATVCHRFLVDPTKFGDGEVFAKLYRTIARVKSKSLVAASLLAAKKVAKHNFTLGARVFFKVLGADFMNNYASGIVVGATRDQILIAGTENFSALMYPNAVLTDVDWEKKRERLIKTNKINDPTGLTKISIKNLTRLKVYFPPSAKALRKKRIAAGKVKIVKGKAGSKISKTITLSSGE